MSVLRKSPWYQEISQEAEARGRLEGKAQEALSLVLRLLNRRIGSVPIELTSQIQQLSIETLESLAEALLDFHSLEDLQLWLNNHQ